MFLGEKNSRYETDTMSKISPCTRCFRTAPIRCVRRTRAAVSEQQRTKHAAYASTGTNRLR